MTTGLTKTDNLTSSLGNALVVASHSSEIDKFCKELVEKAKAVS